MYLTTGNVIRGKSSSFNSISYAIFGKNTTGFASLVNPLGQGDLNTTASKLYTADRDVTITEIQLSNLTNAAVSGVILYLNGIPINGAFTIPANATFTYSDGVWNTDTNTIIFTGVNTNQITVSSTPPTNPQVNDLWVEIP